MERARLGLNEMDGRTWTQLIWLGTSLQWKVVVKATIKHRVLEQEENTLIS
jgi:hypothetical protein